MTRVGCERSTVTHGARALRASPCAEAAAAGTALALCCATKHSTSTIAHDDEAEQI